MKKCGYKSGAGCLMKNPTFPLHTCDGLDKCRYKGRAKAPKSATSFGLLERLVRLRCFMGIHKLDYSDPDKMINDWAICRDCLNEYKIFNRGRWYQTKYFIK